MRSLKKENYKIIMLDNQSKIAQLDSKNMRGSIESLGKQIEEVLTQAKLVKMPTSYKKVSNIVFFGMGGSGIGMHFIKSVFFNSLKIPVEIINGYHSPMFLSNKSLVIASSYSGSTEEILHAVQEAKKKKAKILVVCSGGQLADWARKNKVPALVFEVNNNPCGSPRMGLGYSIFGQIAMLANLGIVKLSPLEIKAILQVIYRYIKLFGISSSQEENSAKQIATSVFGKSVWYVGSEHLSGNAHVAANQLNENAKRFSGYFLIPELNHHLMEGMLYPEHNKQTVKFVFLRSDLYDKKVQKRYEITKQILDKNGIEHVSYVAQERNKLLQACEVLVLGSYISFYSAMLQGIDPTAIPFVDFFKEQLKK